MTPYPSSHLGYPIGLFVNRNHNAVFLLLSMPVVAALAARRMQNGEFKDAVHCRNAGGPDDRRDRGDRHHLANGARAVAGSSRRVARASVFPPVVPALAVPSTLALAGVAATISWVGGFNRNLARFSSLHDGRFDYWDDVSWALHHYGLAGTGFGTFVPVYQTAESLSRHLAGDPQPCAQRFHRDRARGRDSRDSPAPDLLRDPRRRGDAADEKALRLQPRLAQPCGALGIMLVLAFSLVDYPLRMPAISCTFALLCACFLPTPVPVAARQGIGSGRSAAIAELDAPMAQRGRPRCARRRRDSSSCRRACRRRASCPTIMRARGDGRRGRLRLMKPLPRMRLPLRNRQASRRGSAGGASNYRRSTRRR